MSKYYAVVSGRKKGIFETWDECKAQVHKFSGAKYKSFHTLQEAEEYFENLGVDLVEKSAPTQAAAHKTKVKVNPKFNYVDVYTDGSHKRNVGYVGGGIYCKYEDKEYKESFTCDDDFLEGYGIEGYTISNPTAEFLALAQLLYYFYQQPLLPNLCIRVWIDYDEVRNWMNGLSRTNAPYIKKIKETCDNMLKGIKCQVELHRVEGHSNDPGNDAADKLAKDETVHSNISELVEALRFETVERRDDLCVRDYSYENGELR
jgi:ribonuclease H-related protein